MKKAIKIILVCAVLAIALTALYVLTAFLGNPLSAYLARKTAEEHLSESYPDDLVIDEVFYSFKDSLYYATVTDPDSIDGSFYLAINLLGRLVRDSYADDVLSGRNTAERLYDGYRTMVSEVLESAELEGLAEIAFGSIAYTPSEYKDDPSTPDYALITEELERDKEYDIAEVGAVAGSLTLYFESEEPSIEQLAQILLRVKAVFDEAGVPFYAINCVLNGYIESTDESVRLEVMDFLYADIYEDGLADRVAEADAAARAYYEQYDKEDDVIHE